ncbi:hypothetical protein QJU89_07775 [Pasteurella skyensis]|uniref:DUF6630 domain-containing protein n=1 Tax=Phocoenobacter skyensis TaxID=97481 RepID=A0AAJ6N9U5_9PAST|nr:hypothetical protein [Pasteurella skyensis]MDP8162980.1 hypothetical protein [Pasteurella skyensis]MDP8172868.1 hypothetical protein [Pasteurella skyensis]MDP8176686.1 hypothetical protein [Pasteurella skyensis]MDP8179368.1 hypothetical protein [Pasteurella skyensis]MDP8183590.1 hypothetical protein [Pasteurella skyensis]
MKNKKIIYFVALILLLLVAVYQLINLKFLPSPTFWQMLGQLWGVIIFVLLFWSRKECIGTGWLPEKKQPQSHIPSYLLDETITHEEYLASVLPTLFDASETEKQAYIELAKLCCSIENQEKLIPFFNTLKNFEGEDVYGTTLNFVMEFCDRNRINFIVSQDCKFTGYDLEYCVDNYLEENYKGIKVDFSSYDLDECVANTSLLENVSQFLQREHQLQLGLIDTESDEFVIIIHKIADKEKVEKWVKDIGYRYEER